jgi:uncharacterized protein YndB with AHSA1/START domain
METWTVTIDASPERVWPLVGDLGRHHEWSPKPYRMEWLSGEPNAVGSTFRSVGWLPQDKNHEMQGRVTANEPNARFEIVSSDKQGEVTNRFTLTSQGNSTVVERTMILPPAGAMGKIVMAVVLPLLVRPGVQKGMDMLKQRAESNSPS